MKDYGKMGENLLIEWTAPYGPHKGERVSSWFYAEEPQVKEYIDKYEGKIIDRK